MLVLLKFTEPLAMSSASISAVSLTVPTQDGSLDGTYSSLSSNAAEATAVQNENSAPVFNTESIGASSVKPVPEKWRETVARYAEPKTLSAITQLCTTIIPLVILFAAMHALLEVHYGLVMLLTIPTALLLVRSFIIMHDCGHGSFFASRRWNDIVGFITGVMTLTPYVHWRKEHAIHHATSGNLDKRGFGDVTTLTVKEYLALPWWGRLQYRIYRSPPVLLGLGPIWIILKHRIPGPVKAFGPKERLSVYSTDIVLVALLAIGAMTGVLGTALLLYLPAVVLAGAIGIWLFYVQHQFEGTYWERSKNWDYATAAIYGSTYLKLPKFLQWFTGHIGLHHIHHLSPRIPNYVLERCHNENQEFHAAPTIGLWEGIKTLSLKLWDEDRQCLIRFSDLRRMQR